MEKKLTASEKKREANIKRQQAKREAKAKEIEDALASGDISDYLPSTRPGTKDLPSNKRNELNGNPVITQALKNTMMFWRCEPVRSDNELCERLAWYFDTCAETQQLPTYEKMCLACGYSKDWIGDILKGKSKGFTPLTSEILKKARELLASTDGELALQSKIQPVVYMFRSKNFYDMADKQEVVTTTANPLGETTDPTTIAEKYKQLPND